MTAELLVLMSGQRVGEVRHTRGDLSFLYYEDWQEQQEAYPLSLSMPLAKREHGDNVVRPYLEGLLPDSEAVLEGWARRFGVSARNPFSLLWHVGEEVAGAAQFVQPPRVDAIATDDGSVEWLSDSQVAERLRELAVDHSAWRRAGDLGHFSLAGAQPKTALLRSGGRWGVPSGAIPTTHIVKPPLIDLPRFAENEHLCLKLAQALGLTAANSELLRFEDELAIVVERYDRVITGGRLVRIHQEDVCQSTAVSPRTKYESEGGPGVATIIRLLRDNSSNPGEDVDRFVAALALNWVIGGPDAHAKNYSILIAPQGSVRLAPLYDIVSVLPYPDRVLPRKIKLAMRIGGEYQLGVIQERHWRRLATENDLDPERVLTQVETVAKCAREVATEVVAEQIEAGLDSEFAVVFEKSVLENTDRCLAAVRRDK